MKNVLKPFSPEKAKYYSDFSETSFDQLPPITVKWEFNYGSKLDGTAIEMHFTDEEFLIIYNSFKDKLSKDRAEKIDSLIKELIN